MSESVERYSDKFAAAAQYTKEKDYWLDTLSGDLGSRNFPYDYLKTAGKAQEKTFRFEIAGELFAKLIKMSGGSEIRLHMILVAGVVLLLGKYNDDDVLVGAPIYKQEIEGEFINTVVALRHRLDNEMTFKQLIIQARGVITGAVENANFPMETLLYLLDMEASENEFPLFDVAVLLESIHDGKYIGHIPNNITFRFRKSDAQLEGNLDYNSSLFEKTTVERIAGHFLQLMQVAVFNLDLPVSSLSMLPEEEKTKILQHFNSNRMDFARDKTVHQLFREHAERSPESIAISFDGDDVTYRELDERTDCLANVLEKIGVGEDRLVGVLLNRSPLMVESILAVWKAGGAYIPLSPEYPPPRIVEILEDSGAAALLTVNALIDPDAGIEKDYKGNIVRLDEESDFAAIENVEKPDLKTNMDSLAYVIYTSGSTGKPKGVMVEHIGMMNHIHAKVNDLEMTGESIVAQNASHTFDISVWQFFAALVLGGETIIYSNELVMEPERFIHRLVEDRVTILEVVPSYLSLLLEFSTQRSVKFPDLRYLLVTGDVLGPSLVKEWFDRYPGIKMVNAYGPTEASDDITHFIMERPPHRERIPIGSPLRNLNIYIVDKNMKPCPIGVKGEICVSGIGVGRGYLNDEKKTKRVFLEDPFADGPGIRFYKTGDFGCWLPDGTVDFFGRKDSQVKIRGFRIELGEIERKLASHTEVKEAVVIVNGKTDRYLCAYVVCNGLGDMSRLKEYLSRSLPAYSVPAYFVKLERMPLTPNGKIDRKMLPEPGEEGPPEIMYITGEELQKASSDMADGKKTTGNAIPWEEDSPAPDLSGEEMRQVLFTFNDTAVEYPEDKTAVVLFEEQVEKTPDNVAVVHKRLHLSYRRLNERANQPAGLLRTKGVNANRLVGIMAERTVELMLGVIAVLKAGGAYLPIDPENPEERKKYILESSEIELLLTNVKAEEIPGNSVSEIIELTDETHYTCDPVNPPVISTPSDLAYVMFTSGTTGLPKGVMIENRSLSNLIKGVTDIIDIGETDTILSVIPASFDMFGSETLLPLSRGAKVVIGTTEEQRDYNAAAAALRRGCITLFQDTPSHLQLLLSEAETAESLTYLKYLVLAGEKLPEAVKEKAAQVMQGKIFDFYGPTEATIFATGKEVTEDNYYSIGKPLANTRICILNGNGKLLPVGAVGELCIGGHGLARGYLKQEELTAEKFIKNPYIKGERLYRTGDLARWLPNGDIEYLGRMDHQVQIRGIRVELGEIENALLRYEGVKEAVVTVRRGKNAKIELCACVTADKKLSEVQLREYLMDKIPLYMLPTYFIQLEKMPLTPNGKINRRLLETIELKENSILELNHEAPRSPVEKKLTEIWESVLGRETIGINENFFMIGGDSIKTIQIASRMKKAGYKIEMKDIFQNPTIAQLAPLLKKSDHIAEQAPVSGTLPLVPAQKAFFSSMPTAPHHFNMAVMLFSKQGFDEEAIRTVFKKIQEHHDALRMTFKISGEDIVQTNQPLEYPLFLEVVDLGNQKNAAEALERKVNEIQSSINLETGPLLKLGLFRLEDGDRLLIVIHHLVIDGVSWRILLEDFAVLYHQYQNSRQLELPPKGDSFKNWTERLHEYADSESLLKEISYWNVFESERVPRIKPDFPEEAAFEEDSCSSTFQINAEDTKLLLENVNQAFGTEINDILLTALGLAVKKSFGNRKTLVSLEGHGREEIIEGIDVKRCLGWFTSAYPAILDISHEDDLSRQIKEIKETLRRVPHKGISHGILKYLTSGEHKKEIEFKLKPQIGFNYLGQFDEDIDLQVFELAKEPVQNNRSPLQHREYEFDIVGFIVDKQLNMSVTFSKTQFKPGTVEAFIDRFRSELINIINFCGGRGERELTPSDFGYKDISLEQLDTIFD